MQPFCTGKPDGLHADPTDCTKYYSCSNNVQHSLSCQSTLVFNPYCSCCDWPDNYDCQGVSDFNCEGRADGVYADPEDCTAFFECEGNGQQLSRTRCNEGTVFNPNCPCCDWPANYECPDPPTSKYVSYIWIDDIFYLNSCNFMNRQPFSLSPMF